MARKRPESEISKALHSANASDRLADFEARMAAQDAEQTAKAREYCASIGLLRGADEPYDDWVKRVRKHLKATVYGRLVA